MEGLVSWVGLHSGALAATALSLERPSRFVEFTVADDDQKRAEKAASLDGRQIVDLPRPVVERRPHHARYVSEFNSKVAHETQDPKEGETPAPTLGSLSKPRDADDSARRRGHEDRERAPHVPDDGVPVTDDGSGSVAVPAPPASDGPGGTPVPPSDDPNSGGGSMDHPAVDEGDRLALNTERWLGAAFFNRVRRAVRRQWNPADEYEPGDPLAQSAASERTTVLRVVLDGAGQLLSCDLLQSSGDERLDGQAFAALTHAAPFAAPPRSLLAHDGHVHFDYRFTLHLKRPL